MLHVKCESSLVCFLGGFFDDTSVIVGAVLEGEGRRHVAFRWFLENVKVEIFLVEVNHLISRLRPAIAIDNPDKPRLSGIMLEPAFKACFVVQVDQDAFAIGFSVLICLPLVEPIF